MHDRSNLDFDLPDVVQVNFMVNPKARPDRRGHRVGPVPVAAGSSVDDVGRVEPISRRSVEREARRQSIIDTVLELAAQGGPDAVQLRDVERLSGISRRTIYKYFGSRTILLSEAMMSWLNATGAQALSGLSGTSLDDRYLSLCRGVFDRLEKEPRLLETFVRLAPDLGGWSANWGQEQLSAVIRAELQEEFDDLLIDDLVMIMASVAYAGLSLCAAGHLSFDEAWSRLERTARRLLRPEPRRRHT
jgi:AcrR family transcriptional regulator